MGKCWVLIVIASAVLGLDIMLKAYTHHNIPVMSILFPMFPYGGVPIFQDWHGIDFSINHVINYGAAWGVLGGYGKWLLVLRISMILCMAYYLFFYNKKSENKLPLTLILTGACANVIDYFIYGHVVDMFHFNFWGYSFAIFNIADAAICLGVFFMILFPWLAKTKPFFKGLKTR